MDKDLVILVDEQDGEIGLKEKLAAHHDGDLHRAISVFLFDSAGRMLLQRRATGKYHSGGLWTNTSCSHPRPAETVLDAAVRRLHEEMGIRCPDLEHAFSFTYKADVGNNLTEHELDHVFTGSSDVLPVPDPLEVMDYRYASFADIEKDLQQHPEHYTTWFRLIFERIRQLRERTGA